MNKDEIMQLPPNQAMAAFLTEYRRGNVDGADFNSDGKVTPADYNAFMMAYGDKKDGLEPGWSDLRMFEEGAAVTLTVGPNSSHATIAEALDSVVGVQSTVIVELEVDTVHEMPSYWDWSGASPDRPIIVRTNRDPGYSAPQAVLVNTSGKSCFRTRIGTGYIENVILFDLRLEPRPASVGDGSGIECVDGNLQSCLFEGLTIHGFRNGVTIQDFTRGSRASGIKIRRCHIVPRSTYSHSQGVFAKAVDNLDLEENVIVMESFADPEVRREHATVFGHGVYVQGDCQGVQSLGNVIAFAQSHAIQQRSGGVLDGNVAIYCPIGFLAGAKEGDATNDDVIMDGNLSINAIDIRPRGGSWGRGWGFHIENVAFTADQNMMVDDFCDETNYRPMVFGTGARGECHRLVAVTDSDKEPVWADNTDLGARVMLHNMVSSRRETADPVREIGHSQGIIRIESERVVDTRAPKTWVAPSDLVGRDLRPGQWDTRLTAANIQQRVREHYADLAN